MKIEEMQDFANKLASGAEYMHFCELQSVTSNIKVQRRKFALFLTLKAKTKAFWSELRFAHEKITFYRILRQALPVFVKAM